MERLTAEIGIGYESIKKLQIEECMNEYARGRLLVDLGSEDAVLAGERIGKDTQINITYECDEVSYLLFQGNVSSICMEHDGSCQLEMNLVSSFHKMDLDGCSRSFQDQEADFQDILNQIVSEENGTKLRIWDSGMQKTEKLFIQYEETDWEFVKRLSSYMKLPVFEEMNASNGMLHIGIPERKGKIPEHSLDMEQGKNCLRESHQAICTRSIRFRSGEYHKIGDTLLVNHHSYVISKKVTSYFRGEVFFVYDAVMPQEIKCEPYDNQKITGAAIGGTILKRNGSYARVQLDIDESQKEDAAWWFPIEVPYAAGNGVGFYLLADEGERVEVYFPQEKETAGSVHTFLHSEADVNDKLSDASIKYIGTGEETYAKFESGSICILGSEGISIALSDETGINITGSGRLSVHTEKKAELYGKCISVNGADQLSLSTRTSSIIIDEITHLYGINGVWENGQPAKQRI